MRKLVFAILLSCLLVALLFAGKENVPPVKASPDIYQGDLVLAGNNVTIIEGRFDINGSIIVEENATLILKNALVNFTQTIYYEHNMFFQNPANGHPRLQAINSTITTKSYMSGIYLYDNSSATFSGFTSSTALLSAQSFATASVVNSTIPYLSASGSTSVSVFFSTISDQLRASDSSFVSIFNSTIGRFRIVPRNVDCILKNVGPGYVSSWNFLVNSSVSIAPLGSAPNVTLRNTEVEYWLPEFYGTSNVTITDSLLGHLDPKGYTTVWMVNSTSIWGVDCSPGGKVYVSWYLDVQVLDSIDQKVPSANVTATYPNATVAEAQPTNDDGQTKLTLMEKMINATGEYPVGNYTVEATYGIHSDQTTVNMTENQQITLTLADFIIPEFPSFLILPLFMVGTLFAVIICRRKYAIPGNLKGLA